MRIRSLSLTAVCLLSAAPAGLTGRQADQIALAVLPLPEAERATASVYGYRGGGGELTLLRRGDGDFVCIADNPSDERFQAACYHKSLEAYMARGRELRAQGIRGQASIHQRWEEIDAGTLEMPRHPAALFQVIHRDASAVTPDHLEGIQRMTVIYMAYATAEETGFPVQPSPGIPWLMYPGKPTAHVMIMN